MITSMLINTSDRRMKGNNLSKKNNLLNIFAIINLNFNGNIATIYLLYPKSIYHKMRQIKHRFSNVALFLSRGHFASLVYHMIQNRRSRPTLTTYFRYIHTFQPWLNFKTY